MTPEQVTTMLEKHKNGDIAVALRYAWNPEDVNRGHIVEVGERMDRPKPINTVLYNGRVERRYYSDTQSDELIAYMDQQDTAVEELREALSSWVTMCHDGYDPEPSAEFVEECRVLIARHAPPETPMSKRAKVVEDGTMATWPIAEATTLFGIPLKEYSKSALMKAVCYFARKQAGADSEVDVFSFLNPQ